MQSWHAPSSSLTRATNLSQEAVLCHGNKALVSCSTFQRLSTMHVCAHASLGSSFVGNTKAFRTPSSNAVRSTLPRRRFNPVAKIDTGYKKQADSDGQKSTVEDQLHEAEINKNAKSFVKEFKEDLGATGEKQSQDDKKEIKERDEDNLGLGRQKQDFDREQESKEIGKELNT